MAGFTALFTPLGFGPTGWGPLMLRAAGVTVSVAFCGYVTGLAIGIIGAWAKLAGSPWLRRLAEAYTTVLRGVPDLLVIFLFYFGSSAAITPIANSMGYGGFVALPGFLAGFLAVGVVAGAYHTEVLRGAVSAVNGGEIEAARAFGMSRGLLFRRVIGPLALRSGLPGLANVWQLVLKEAALVSVTGVTELVRQAQLAAGATRDPFTFYLAAGCLYLLISVVTNALFQLFENRAMRGLRRS